MAKFPENFATLTLIWLQIYINYTMTTNFLQNILFYNIPLKHFFCSKISDNIYIFPKLLF